MSVYEHDRVTHDHYGRGLRTVALVVRTIPPQADYNPLSGELQPDPNGLGIQIWILNDVTPFIPSIT